MRPKGRRLITSEEILDEIRRLSQAGTVTQSTFEQYAHMGTHAVANHFGSFNNALRAAGLPVNQDKTPTFKECPVCGKTCRAERGRKARITCGDVSCTRELQSISGKKAVADGRLTLPPGCAGKSGEEHPLWKGDDATPSAKLSRAHRRYPATICSLCDSQDHVQRHHIDHNQGNNAPHNIAILCRRCHMDYHNGRIQRSAIRSVAEVAQSEMDLRPVAPKKRRSQPEKAIQREITTGLRRLGFYVEDMSQPRPTMLPRGLPDLYVRHAGARIRFWIECKAGKNKPSKDQKAWHEVEKECGGAVLVAYGLDDVVDYLTGIGFFA